ncbi:hypothetical protein CLOP_g25035 [Closterium sp. NIES-67]|nr:hypothetical protein CLOP_g25035 [Closterium sp. NIES-67]
MGLEGMGLEGMGIGGMGMHGGVGMGRMGWQGGVGMGGEVAGLHTTSPLPSVVVPLPVLPSQVVPLPVVPSPVAAAAGARAAAVTSGAPAAAEAADWESQLAITILKSLLQGLNTVPINNPAPSTSGPSALAGTLHTLSVPPQQLQPPPISTKLDVARVVNSGVLTAQQALGPHPPRDCAARFVLQMMRHGAAAASVAAEADAAAAVAAAAAAGDAAEAAAAGDAASAESGSSSANSVPADPCPAAAAIAEFPDANASPAVRPSSGSNGCKSQALPASQSQQLLMPIGQSARSILDSVGLLLDSLAARKALPDGSLTNGALSFARLIGKGGISNSNSHSNRSEIVTNRTVIVARSTNIPNTPPPKTAPEKSALWNSQVLGQWLGRFVGTGQMGFGVVQEACERVVCGPYRRALLLAALVGARAATVGCKWVKALRGAGAEGVVKMGVGPGERQEDVLPLLKKCAVEMDLSHHVWEL